MLTHFLIPVKIFHLVKKNMNLLSHYLDEMYNEENQGIGKTVVILDEESAAVGNNYSNVYAEATPSEEPPDNWVFPGYHVAFCLFGCSIITE